MSVLVIYPPPKKNTTTHTHQYTHIHTHQKHTQGTNREPPPLTHTNTYTHIYLNTHTHLFLNTHKHKTHRGQVVVRGDLGGGGADAAARAGAGGENQGAASQEVGAPVYGWVCLKRMYIVPHTYTSHPYTHIHTPYTPLEPSHSNNNFKKKHTQRRLQSHAPTQGAG